MLYMNFQNGSHAYIIESNRTIREVTVVRRSGDFYLVRFDSNGGVQLRGSRLFVTKEEAEATLPQTKVVGQKKGYCSPYDY